MYFLSDKGRGSTYENYLTIKYTLIKEGYKKEDIIFTLMEKKEYNEYMMEDYYDMMVMFI